MSWKQFEKFYFQKERLDEKIGWDHSKFNQVRLEIKEEEDFIKKPFEVEEGAMECRKCKSSKTFSYQKQVRSADEGFSTFVFCFNCKERYREN